MAYRNGIYAAFDGQGETNPTASDIKYFNLLKSWAEKEDFSYIDSHKKTRSVRDSSLEKTLKSVLRERLRNSRVMIIILSDDTNYDRGLLNYEIEQALDTYKLPLIIAYPGIEGNINEKWTILEKRWPKSLKMRLNGPSHEELSCLHTKFNKKDIINALQHMTVHNIKYKGSKWYI
ncbi:hypothetical protein CN485_15870 [Bacillus cereus]|nr:hypothetical protein CN485_15870 [Bacillus cereus]PEY98956.1 hypothetical protein CN349_16355 [Bacillus cereus]PGP65806.1 hypothetical protein CN998_24450 [Bacillus cereus]